MINRPAVRLSLLILACAIFSEKPAYGYIDPSAQGLLAQALTPLLIIAATCLTFLRKQVVAACRWVTGHILRKRIETGD
jgi:hypothetical protein